MSDPDQMDFLAGPDAGNALDDLARAFRERTGAVDAGEE